MIGQKSEKPRVGIYNVASGKTVFIAPKNNADDYLTNLAFTPDEKYVLIAELNRGQNDMNLNLYETTTGNFVRTLFNEKNPKCELAIDGGLRYNNMDPLLECNPDVVILSSAIFKDPDGIEAGVRKCRKALDDAAEKFGLE